MMDHTITIKYAVSQHPDHPIDDIMGLAIERRIQKIIYMKLSQGDTQGSFLLNIDEYSEDTPKGINFTITWDSQVEEAQYV